MIRQASESIAYVLMRQAKIDDVSVFKILDTLKHNDNRSDNT